MIDILFNRPSTPIDLSQLFVDISQANSRLAIAAAWLTDTELVNSFNSSPAQEKIAILNNADLKRGSWKAVKMLKQYIDNEKEKREQERAEIGIAVTATGIYDKMRLVCRSSTEEWDLAYLEYENICRDVEIKFGYKEKIRELVVLGSDDWKQGVMHHKFIVADGVVWFGSFNFTFNARNNYETLARVAVNEVADQFWEEASAMAGDNSVWNGNPGDQGSTVSRCYYCEQVFPADAMLYDSHSGACCQKCDQFMTAAARSMIEREAK